MNLIYLDESGNTGTNLSDPQQPIFVLCALVVGEAKWKAVEGDLQNLIRTEIPFDVEDSFEIHASEIRNGVGKWRGISVSDRIAFRDKVLDVAVDHNLQVFARPISKKRYRDWLQQTVGKGVIVNPHITAYVLLAHALNEHLKKQGNDELGILINDENKDVIDDVELTTRLLRANPGALHLDRIIEKGFFIDSRKSHLLQLADLCAFYIRKDEEEKSGKHINSQDQGGIERVKKLMSPQQLNMMQALQWLSNHYKKRSGEGPGGTESPEGGRSRR